jgi:hypothetical protein
MKKGELCDAFFEAVDKGTISFACAGAILGLAAIFTLAGTPPLAGVIVGPIMANLFIGGALRDSYKKKQAAQAKPGQKALAPK